MPTLQPSARFTREALVAVVVGQGARALATGEVAVTGRASPTDPRLPRRAALGPRAAVTRLGPVAKSANCCIAVGLQCPELCVKLNVFFFIFTVSGLSFNSHFFLDPESLPLGQDNLSKLIPVPGGDTDRIKS